MYPSMNPEIIPQHGSPPDESEATSDSEEAPKRSLTSEFSEEPGIDLLSTLVLNTSIHGPGEGYPPTTPLQAETLHRIRDWTEDSATPSPVMWLNGPPGVGKTVSVHKIVEIYRASNRLAASFFCHKDEGNVQARALFPTIAYQLANNIESLRAPINHIISEDPTLFDRSLDDQFQSLIVRPFQDSGSLNLPIYIVVIDGFDELQGQEFQLRVLDVIAARVTASKIPLRFLISSRPELHIQNAFDANSRLYGSERLYLTGVSSLKDVSSIPSNLINSHSDNSANPILRRILPSKFSKPMVQSHKRAASLDSFPKLVTVQAGNGYAESYSRSLMMTGNGFPLWYPGGDLGKPMQYLQKGVSIGDVGTLDRDGLFDFCFNIFLPPDDPVHSYLVPTEFKPIEPALDPSEVKFVPDYFKSGQVITSQGITATKLSDDPLDISFASTDREGGVLVLPNGASREDLVKSERIHEYVKRNSPHWYQDVNGYGGVVHTNGSLFLVTGCDKANDWALASFPYYAGVRTRLDLQYTWQPEYSSPWTDRNTARTSSYAPSTSRPIPVDSSTRHQCVFVRGMRISLSDKSWRETMPPSESARLFYTCILRTPSSLELLMNNVLVYLRLRVSERRAMKKVTPNRLQLFHPNFVIGQVLLKQSPDSDVALVDDSVWCSLTHKSICTMSEINDLVTAVFDRNDVVEHNGVVSLTSKADNEYTVNTKLPHSTAERPLWSKFSFPKILERVHGKKDIHWIQDIPVSEHAKLF